MADKRGPKRTRLCAVKDWSKQEKFDLLQGLKQFRSWDVKSIAGMIPSKTRAEIKNAIAYYKDIATAVKPTPVPARKLTRTTKRNYRPVPLCSWAKLLQDSFEYKQLETATADSIRLIAQYGDIPPAKRTSSIDFRKVYHAIADAIEGKPLSVDPFTAAVLEKCMFEAALYSKKFNETFYEGLNLSGSPEQSSQPTDTRDETYLKELASQTAYNPLNMPVECLKPEAWSSTEVSSDSDDESTESADSD